MPRRRGCGAQVPTAAPHGDGLEVQPLADAHVAWRWTSSGITQKSSGAMSLVKGTSLQAVLASATGKGPQRSTTVSF